MLARARSKTVSQSEYYNHNKKKRNEAKERERERKKVFNYLKDHGLVYLNGQGSQREDCVVCGGGRVYMVCFNMLCSYIVEGEYCSCTLGQSR